MDTPEPEKVVGVGGTIGFLLTVAYATIRAIRYARKQVRADHKEAVEGEVELAEKTEDAAHRRRREAAAEAWEVVDTQKEMIRELQDQIEQVSNKCDAAIRECQKEREECNQERAYLLGRLEIVEQWAVAKGMKVPPKQKPGSGVHKSHQDGS